MEELIKKAKSGDCSAVEEIINVYMPLVINQAHKYKIPGYDHEDIVQHSILSIIKGIKLYKVGDTSFSSFIAKVVKNNNVNLLKSKMKHNREVQNEELLNDMPSENSFTVEDQVIAYDMVLNINKAIAKLDSTERKVIVDFYIKRKKLKAIADECKITYRQAVYIKENVISKMRIQT
ncbi:hypothetical protein SH2C18_20160 [Clostridium sediminicola]|uniref:sigma-70 family RNA polymerase sigma factor n=1 Tax=Clostridium sediminicola TaxID=3114879 RepID=UPI0031F2049A